MDHPRRLIPGAVILLMLGTVTMSRFAAGVRSVAVVGLAGSGFALGVGLSFLIYSLLRRAQSPAAAGRP